MSAAFKAQRRDILERIAAEGEIVASERASRQGRGDGIMQQPVFPAKSPALCGPRGPCDGVRPAGKDGRKTRRVRFACGRSLSRAGNRRRRDGPRTERRAAWMAGAARLLSAPSTSVAAIFASIFLLGMSAVKNDLSLPFLLARKLLLNFGRGVGAFVAAERSPGGGCLPDLLLRVASRKRRWTFEAWFPFEHECRARAISRGEPLPERAVL